MGDPLLVYHNLGLGDHIVCCGMIRYLAIENEILLFAKHKNIQSVNALFGDLKTVHVLGIKDEHDAKSQMEKLRCDYDVLLVGCPNASFDEKGKEPFDIVLYRHANVPHEYRWMGFKYTSPAPVFAPKGKYVFVHEDLGRGFKINMDRIDQEEKQMQMIRPDLEHGPITNWISVLENAYAIHCINSSFLLLADSVKTHGKLYWHKYARDEGPLCTPTVKKQWKEVLV